MKQKITLTILAGMVAAIAMFFFVAPSFSPAHAQTTPSCTTNCSQQGLNDIGTAFPTTTPANYSVKDIAKTIINWALYLAAIIAVIFIIIGGFLYITSAGDPGRAGKGRTTLVNALIGLAIIILSYLIVQIVYNFLTQPH